MCHCDGPCTCAFINCASRTASCISVETCPPPCPQCYYCERTLGGTLYVYRPNPTYFSCKPCVPTDSDWCRQRDKPACTPEPPKKCCHCCKKSIKGTCYVYRDNPKHAVCASCLPCFDRSEWCRSDSYKFQSRSKDPKCMCCCESLIHGTRYLYKKNKSYSICKRCLPYYEKSDWCRDGKFDSCISDCEKCIHCKNWPINGTVYTYKKYSAYHLCRNCLPWYDSDDWMPRA